MTAPDPGAALRALLREVVGASAGRPPRDARRRAGLREDLRDHRAWRTRLAAARGGRGRDRLRVLAGQPARAWTAESARAITARPAALRAARRRLRGRAARRAARAPPTRSASTSCSSTARSRPRRCAGLPRRAIKARARGRTASRAGGRARATRATPPASCSTRDCPAAAPAAPASPSTGRCARGLRERVCRSWCWRAGSRPRTSRRPLTRGAAGRGGRVERRRVGPGARTRTRCGRSSHAVRREGPPRPRREAAMTAPPTPRRRSRACRGPTPPAASAPTADATCPRR